MAVGITFSRFLVFFIYIFTYFPTFGVFGLIFKLFGDESIKINFSFFRVFSNKSILAFKKDAIPCGCNYLFTKQMAYGVQKISHFFSYGYCYRNKDDNIQSNGKTNKHVSGVIVF